MAPNRRSPDRPPRRPELRAGGPGRLPGLPLDALARAGAAARHAARRSSTTLDGPVFGEDAIERARPRPDPPARGRAARRADHRHRPRARRGRPADPRARSSRSGRRTPAAATATRSTSIPRRSTRTSPAPAAASPTPRAATASSRSSPARTRGATTRTRGGRRTSTSRSSAAQFTQRLVTQMYFPGDPLFEYDPIFNSVRDPKARELLVARFDLETTQPEWALGYRVGHRPRPRRPGTTPMEDGRDAAADAVADGRPVLRDRPLPRDRRTSSPTAHDAGAVRLIGAAARRRRGRRSATG